MRLRGKHAVVTGAGQGIGRAIAIAFASEGAQVRAVSKTGEKMSDLPSLNARIEPFVGDVTDASVWNAAKAFNAEILVNCAGHVAVGGVLDSSDEDWNTCWQINVMAAVHMSRAVLPAMIARRSGSIINIASVASSITGVKDRAAYGTSKAALIGLTKALAREHIADGVRCNAVCPGTTDTPSLQDRIAATDDPDAMRRAFVARQPMGRLGDPDEIAQAAVFLASDAAAFMTGSVLVMDGGQTL